MAVYIELENPNCVIGKFNADINCLLKRGTGCYECICYQHFYPDVYA